VAGPIAGGLMEREMNRMLCKCVQRQNQAEKEKEKKQQHLPFHVKPPPPHLSDVRRGL